MIQKPLLREVLFFILALVAVVVCDWIGPWYLPVFVFIGLGVGRAFGLPIRGSIVCVWPMYAAVVVGIWTRIRNPEFAAGLAQTFSLPQPGLLWCIPFAIYLILAGLAFFVGQNLGILIFRSHAR